MPFPQRSLPWLLATAAWGGLKPAPVSRIRGAVPHLLCSYAHFILKVRSWRTCRNQKLDNKKGRAIWLCLFECLLNNFYILGFSLLSFPLLLSLPDLRSGICWSYENWRLSMPERLPSLLSIMFFILETECFYKERTIAWFFLKCWSWVTLGLHLPRGRSKPNFLINRNHVCQCRTLIGSTIQKIPIEIVTIRTDFLMATVHMDGESGLLAFFA